ncbi:hypothetical protein AVEN_28029-1 [Araneus ventricosus]|uniref:RNase H type-1 domain-containing protein n=1 Tax=Araneus ventricosus TaxID=182803 RepID=A0A4Y2BIF0_ARAVE|nr:hypothetical protein AVEN_28029-1 [Araneus ventricosus]
MPFTLQAICHYSHVEDAVSVLDRTLTQPCCTCYEGGVSSRMASMSQKTNLIRRCGDELDLLQTDLLGVSTCNPLIKEVKDFYRHLLSKGARILFSWVPSHVGITGNELAEKSAKSATEFLTQLIVYADVRYAVNQWCHCQWQEKWNMETNNKLHVIKPVHSHWVTKLNRRCDVVLTRLRIGHTRLTHKYLLFAESPPTCSHCGDILSNTS